MREREERERGGREESERGEREERERGERERGERERGEREGGGERLAVMISEGEVRLNWGSLLMGLCGLFTQK